MHNAASNAIHPLPVEDRGLLARSSLKNRLQEMDDQFCKQSQHGEEKLSKFFSLNELNDRKEFVGQLIDIFEDFLEKRHVVLDPASGADPFYNL